MSTRIRLLIPLSLAGTLLLPTLQAASYWDSPVSIAGVADKDKICFAMYTLHHGTLKMMAQLYPLAGRDSRTHHLAEWLIFGSEFGELTRNRPTVCIPDDHDVGQGNLWGASGRQSTKHGGPDGGYLQTPQYVREVEFAQTSCLPDPHDPTPVQRGIGVYYTSLNIGGIDFAFMLGGDQHLATIIHHGIDEFGDAG